MRVIATGLRVDSPWARSFEAGSPRVRENRSVQDLVTEFRRMGFDARAVRVPALDEIVELPFPQVLLFQRPGKKVGHFVTVWDATRTMLFTADEVRSPEWLEIQPAAPYFGGVSIVLEPPCVAPRAAAAVLVGSATSAFAMIALLILASCVRRRRFLVATLVVAACVQGCGQANSRSSRDAEALGVGDFRTWEVGEIPWNAPLTTRVSIPFNNRGSFPLRVERVESTCGCAHAELLPPEVPADGYARLEADILFPTRTNFSVQATIHWEGRAETSTVEIRGYRQEVFRTRWIPETGSLLLDPGGQSPAEGLASIMCEIRFGGVAARESGPVRIERVRVRPETLRVDASIQQRTDGADIEFVVRAEDDALIGDGNLLQLDVELSRGQARGATGAQFNLAVATGLCPDVRGIAPDGLVAGFSTLLTVRADDEQALQDLRILSAPDWVEIDDCDRGTTGRIVYRFSVRPAEDPDAPTRGHVTLGVPSRSWQRIRLPVARRGAR